MSINVLALVGEAQVESIQQQIADETLPQDVQAAISSRVTDVYRVFELAGEMQHCYDILVPDISYIDRMSAYDWTLIGIWDWATGKLLSEFNEALYLEAMPDIVTRDDAGNVVLTERPTVPRDIHRRTGQAKRKFA